jgi:hypothetical protein
MQHLIGKTIKAYRNLNNGKISIKTDKVEGYLETFTMAGVTFTGGHSKAQAKIQAGEHRSVHAYAKGELATIFPANHWPELAGLYQVTYTPKTRPGFYEKETGREVTGAGIVLFYNNKMYCKGLVYA